MSLHASVDLDNGPLVGPPAPPSGGTDVEAGTAELADPGHTRP
jgi:hypothetical protein